MPPPRIGSGDEPKAIYLSTRQYERREVPPPDQWLEAFIVAGQTVIRSLIFMCFAL